VIALFTPHSLLGVLLWLVIAGFILAGIVFLVLALIRWPTGNRKYLLLGLILIPPLAGIVGWVLLFVGGFRRARATEAAAMPPPPSGPAP
jgi:hypothetical protein